jgi:hypothetical protein
MITLLFAYALTHGHISYYLKAWDTWIIPCTMKGIGEFALVEPRNGLEFVVTLARTLP